MVCGRLAASEPDAGGATAGNSHTSMRSVFLTILLVILAPLVVSCGPADESPYHGYLYFARGSYLMQFRLRDGSLAVVTNLGEGTIREISPMGDGKILVSELASISGQDVARISWLDLKTGQSDALYSGVQARYVAGAGVIVYDDGGTLYSVSLAGESGVDSIVLSHTRHHLSAMVEVSDSRVLFETLEEGQPLIHSYRAGTGELQTLDQLTRLCRLEGAVWIGELELLACRERDGAGGEARDSYVLADLDGNLRSRLSLPEERKFLALTFIGGQGALILKESLDSPFGGQENHAVWAHDIYSGENHRLPGTTNLGTSVVYTDY